MADLPDELLEHVISYLPLAARKNARLVCRHWQQVSYFTRLIKNDLLYIKSYEDLRKLDCKWKYFNVKIKHLGNGRENKPCPEFWFSCGKYIKSLILYVPDVYTDCLREIFPNTPNLEQLTLWNSDDCSVIATTPKPAHLTSIPHFTFSKLLSLTVDFSNEPTGEEFRKLVENAPLLEQVNLVYLRHEVKTNLIDSLKDFTFRQRNILRRLRFKSCEIGDELLTTILSNLGPQVEELHLHACWNLTDTCLPIIQTKLVNLRKIDLSSTKFTEEGLQNLLSSLKRLTHVSLTGRLNSERTATVFAAMSQLRSADISCPLSHIFEAQCMRQAFGTCHLPKLTELRMTKLQLTDDLLGDIVPFFPNMTFLYMDDCRALSDLAVKHIAASCKKLRVLSLGNCCKIRDISPVNSLEDLEYLGVSGCQINISARELCLIKLKTIDLRNTRVSWKNFDLLVKNCPLLKDVSLDASMKKGMKSVGKKSKYSCNLHFGKACWVYNAIFDSSDQ